MRTSTIVIRVLMVALGVVLLVVVVPGSVLADDTPPPDTNPPPGASVSVSVAPEPVSNTPVAVSSPAKGAPSLKGGSVWGILPWGGLGWGGLGVGARFMIPVGITPLLRSSTVKDSFAVEFGGDFLHWSYAYGVGSNYGVNSILPVAALMWSVWLNEQFALYPKVELGYSFTWITGYDTTFGPTPTYGGFFWDVAGGALYKLNGGVTLRAEIGYAGLKLGAGFLF